MHHGVAGLLKAGMSSTGSICIDRSVLHPQCGLLLGVTCSHAVSED